jgi:uncharacterized protein (TIRG00374 family)
MANSNLPALGQRDFSEKGIKGLSRGKLFLGGIFFVVITIAIFWYQFHRIAPGDEIPSFDQIRWGYLILILLFLPLETFLSAARIWIICRLLYPHISFWTCLKADLGNAAIAILTPSQMGGGPGQMYFLNRGGVGLSTALTITLLTFVSTLVTLLVMGLYSLFLAYVDHSNPLFIGAVSTLTLVSGLIILSAVHPGFFRMLISGFSRGFWRLRAQKYPLQGWWPPGRPRAGEPADCMGPLAIRLIDILYAYREDLIRFLLRGKVLFIWTCFFGLAFFISRFVLTFFCVRFLGIEASSLSEIIEIQMTLVFLTYLAPTPGSAGIAEEASLSIMWGIVPMGYAPYYNLLWRFTTVYFGAVTGLLILWVSVLKDMANVLRQKRKGEN